MKNGFTSEQANFLVLEVKKYFPEAEIIVFGSRLNGNFTETSDLDICLKSEKPLELSSWAKLESNVAQSDLPFKVDFVDWMRITSDFQKIISKKMIRLER